MMKIKKIHVLFSLLTVAVILFNFVWLKTNKQPLGSDMALHARYANELLRDLKFIKDPVKMVGKMIIAGPSNYYPPFFYDVSIPFQLVFGVSADSIIMTHTFFIVIFALSLFFIGRKVFENDYLALFAAFLPFTFPLMIDSTRESMIDFPLAAMTACSFALLVYNDEFQDTKLAVIFGIVSGLGIITKWFLPTYLFLPFLFVLVRGLIKNPLKALMNTGIAAAIVLALSVPWFKYSGLLSANAVNSRNFTGGAPQLNLNIILPNLSWPLFSKYMTGLYNFSAVMWVLFIIGLAFSFHKKLLGKYTMIFLLFASSLLSWYLMIKTKEPRYNLAHLIAVSFMFMSPIVVLKHTVVKRIYAVSLIFFSLLLYSTITFGFPSYSSVTMNKLLGFSQEAMGKWASRKGPPERKYWPTVDIFETLIADWEPNRKLANRNPVLIYTVSDITGLDHFAYQFYGDCVYKVILCDSPGPSDYFLHYGLDEASFESSLKALKNKGYDFPIKVKEFQRPPLNAPYDKAKIVLYKRNKDYSKVK